MRYLNYLLIAAMAFMMFAACEDLVQDVDPSISQIEDPLLNDGDQLDFVLNGVLYRFSTVVDNSAVLSGGLSDELFFDHNVPNATFPSFENINLNEIPFDNVNVRGLYNNIGQLRLMTDNLLNERIAAMGLEGDDARRANYIGHLYGGLARYYLAVHFGLNPNEGGGTIDGGPFIPSSQLYNSAVDFLEDAKNHTANAYQTRLLNSLIARAHLFNGNYGAAATAAANGLEQGDEAFQSLYVTEASNYWYVQAGPGRTQFVASFRFQDYIDEDPDEANRVILDNILGNDGETLYVRQGKYMERSSPINVMTWQENHLMRAELAIRDGGAANEATARGLINDVRSSHGISDLDLTADIDLDLVEVERDKELAFTGVRAVDQRRFGSWHATVPSFIYDEDADEIVESSLPVGPWRYLPITNDERNENENLDDV